MLSRTFFSLQDGHRFSLVPSAMDQYNAIMGLSLELSSSCIFVFTSNAYNRELFRALSDRSRKKGIHFKLILLHANQNPSFEVLRISKEIEVMNKSSTCVAVLDCSLYYVDLIVETAHFLGLPSSRVSWLMVGGAMKPGMNLDRVPLGVLGFRLPFTLNEFLKDAVALVSHALRDQHFKDQAKEELHNLTCFEGNTSWINGNLFRR